MTDDPNKESVNRDLAKRQEITEDTKKGDLQFSLDMDNRLVTDTGNYVKETAQNTVDLAGNTLTTARRTGQAGTDLLDATVKDLQGDKGVRANGGFIGDFLTKTQLRQASIDFSKADKKSADILKNPDKYTPQERDAALHSFNTYAAKEFGVEAPTSTSGYNGDELAKNQAQDQAMSDGEAILKSQQAGLYDKDRGSIHINEQAQDGSTEALVKVDGHELKHHIDAGKKQETDEHGANRFGNQAYNALSDEIGSGSQGDFASHQQWTQTHTENGNFDSGNQLAANAENVDPAYFAKRPLKGYPWLGVLSINSVDDQSNTEISHEQLFFEDKQGGNIGFFNDSNEPRPDEASLLSKYRPSQDTGYDDSIMREAVKQVSPKNYKLCGANQYNCQDWAQDVRDKYFELESLKNQGKK